MASRGKQPFNQGEILRQVASDQAATAASRLRAIRLIRQSQPKRRRRPDPEPDPVIARAIALMREWASRPDAMPCVTEYRAIPIHDFQSSDRVESLVQPAIDRLLDQIIDPAQLARLAADCRQCPESRLLSAALYIARDEALLASHDTRLGRLARLQAAYAGLDVVLWADPDRYCSLLDIWADDAPPSRRPVEAARRLLALQAVA